MQLNFPPQAVAYCFINAFKKYGKQSRSEFSIDLLGMFLLCLCWCFALFCFTWGAVVFFSLFGSSGLPGAQCPEDAALSVSVQRTSTRAQSIISYLTLSCLRCQGKSAGQARLVTVLLCHRQAWLLRVSLNKLHPSLCR